MILSAARPRIASTEVVTTRGLKQVQLLHLVSNLVSTYIRLFSDEMTTQSSFIV